MTEEYVKDALSSNVVDIDEDHDWKDEVKNLLEEIHHLKNENMANQLLAGLILVQSGPVKIKKQDIAGGLVGWQIRIDEEDTDHLTVSVEQVEEL